MGNVRCGQSPPEGEKGSLEMFPTCIFVGEEAVDATRVYKPAPAGGNLFVINFG